MKPEMLDFAMEMANKIDGLEKVKNMLDQVKYRIDSKSYHQTKKERKKSEAIIDLIEADIKSLDDLTSIYEIKFLKKYLK